MSISQAKQSYKALLSGDFATCCELIYPGKWRTLGGGGILEMWLPRCCYKPDGRRAYSHLFSLPLATNELTTASGLTGLTSFITQKPLHYTPPPPTPPPSGIPLPPVAHMHSKRCLLYSVFTKMKQISDYIRQWRYFCVLFFSCTFSQCFSPSGLDFFCFVFPCVCCCIFSLRPWKRDLQCSFKIMPFALKYLAAPVFEDQSYRSVSLYNKWIKHA